ncbi:DUF1579 domain-containing protein [Romeria aff. gracilis LEGE 07310]|uniref:DUF1579 domain-containing protein n=1 Tax=Vasconcelosia minhoensis LEGE 07310 TaxID=915328 RepID=A0A8J7DDR5_9CYAN|nr:DUF1579 domain-containing protein [Romeria gracilis]MBE9079073.1 DUF1579 domain-containing protein [Romeria aff. gracilis LEGE 07310]
METTTAQQESMMNAEPQYEHQWLQKLVGEWTYETEASMGPDQPSEKATGTENVRSLGGLWIVAEGQGEMPGCGAVTMMITLGYDPQKQRYVGTWVGSMMTYLWVYDGELDADKKVLTLNSQGPAMTGEEKMANYKDVIEFEGDDHRILTSHALGEDGQWHQFMTAHYWRKH